jgi:hypothetical protein
MCASEDAIESSHFTRFLDANCTDLHFAGFAMRHASSLANPSRFELPFVILLRAMS